MRKTKRYASTLLHGFTPQELPDEPGDEPIYPRRVFGVIVTPAVPRTYPLDSFEVVGNDPDHDEAWGELEVQEAEYANVGGLPFDDMSYKNYRGERG